MRTFPFDGTNTYATGQMCREQADLGTAWTLDLCFHATDTRAVNGEVPIFQWLLDTVPNVGINVGVYGSSTGGGNANKVYAVVKTTSNPGIVANTYTLVSDTPLYSSSYISSNRMVRCFVRLTRNGTSLSIATSVALTTTTDTTLSLAQPHQGTVAQNGSWIMASTTPLASSALFKGYIEYVVLRSGAFTATDLQTIQHAYPRAPNVLFFATGANHDGLIREESRFGSHGAPSNPGAIATDRHYPFAKKVQGIGSFTDPSGVTLSVVMVGGLLCYQRMR